MPFTLPRFETGRSASSSISSLQRVARELGTPERRCRASRVASSPRRRGCGSSRRCRRGGRRRHQPSPSSARRHVGTQAFISLALVFSPGRKRSLTRTAPSGIESASVNAGPRFASSGCSRRPCRCRSRPRWSWSCHREPAVARLLGPADHARLEPGGALDLGRAARRRWRVADRAGRHGLHLVHPGGPAERREHGGGVERAVHALGPDRLPRRPFRRRRGPARGSRRPGSTTACPGSYPNTTRRHEFEPMSITATRSTGGMMHRTSISGAVHADAVRDERHRTGICRANHRSEARQPPRPGGPCGPWNRGRGQPRILFAADALSGDTGRSGARSAQ